MMLQSGGMGLGAISAEAQAAIAALLPGAQVVQTLAPTTVYIDGMPYTTSGEHTVVLPDGTRISAEGFQRMLETSDPEAIAGGLQSMLTTAAVATGASFAQAVTQAQAQLATTGVAPSAPVDRTIPVAAEPSTGARLAAGTVAEFAAPPEADFFERYRTPLLIGAAALGAFLLLRRQ